MLNCIKNENKDLEPEMCTVELEKNTFANKEFIKGVCFKFYGEVGQKKCEEKGKFCDMCCKHYIGMKFMEKQEKCRQECHDIIEGPTNRKTQTLRNLNEKLEELKKQKQKDLEDLKKLVEDSKSKQKTAKDQATQEATSLDKLTKDIEAKTAELNKAKENATALHNKVDPEIKNLKAKWDQSTKQLNELVPDKAAEINQSDADLAKLNLEGIKTKFGNIYP